MKMNKLVLIGAVALVVVGCIIAAGCTSQQQGGADAVADPVVGQWTTKYLLDGNTADAVLTLRTDGEGYWMRLGEGPDFRITSISKDTWKKTGENTYLLSSSKGNSYEATYDPAQDTLTVKGSQNGQNTYTRLEPIVGIWFGVSSAATGNGAATTIIRQDGTGIATIADTDGGDVELTTLTWTKNADGTYGLVFSNGLKRTYTVDAAGKTLTTEDGRTKTKQFLDTSFLVSITGPWYNKDNERMVVFNGDGTGFLNARTGVAPFTWKLGEIGKFVVTYAGGTSDDGSSLKEKRFEWIYDRDTDTFIAQSGNKYTRPHESIEGKVTFT